MPNGSLVIYDVTTEDSGKYTCIAGNSCNIKHREAFLYVVGEGTWPPATPQGSGPCCWGFFPATFLKKGFGKSPFTGPPLSAPQTSRRQRRTRAPATTRPTR